MIPGINVKRMVACVAVALFTLGLVAGVALALWVLP